MDYEVQLGTVNCDRVDRERTTTSAATRSSTTCQANGGKWILGKCGDGYGAMGLVVATPASMGNGSGRRDAGRVPSEAPTGRIGPFGLRMGTSSSARSRAQGRCATWRRNASGVRRGAGAPRSPPPIVNGHPPGLDDGATRKQRLEHAACVVTGGARGSGYGIALRPAPEGAGSVASVDVRQDESDAAASRPEEELRRALGGGAARPKTFHGIGCDVASVDEVADAFRRVSASGSGRIDILVQAAG